MTSPLISVVIATYNTGRYLPETLESIFAQTYANYEIIVVDDGSTDDTLTQIAPYLSRIRLIQQTHAGLASARNAGLQLAKGDFIALLDADDLWLPEKLAVQIEIATRNHESGLIVCDGVEFEGERVTESHLLYSPVANKLFKSTESEITGDLYRSLIMNSTISCPAQVLLPRRVWEEIGFFGDFASQDYDYYLRVSKCFPITLHRHSLVRWRYRPESMSGQRSQRQICWGLQKLKVLRVHLQLCDVADRGLLNYGISRVVCHTAISTYDYGNSIDRTYAIKILTELLHTGTNSLTVFAFLVVIQLPQPIRYIIYQGFLALKSIKSRVVRLK